jgi:hypothetical protein
MHVYPVAYVKSLENHAADLEKKLNRQLSGTLSDHLYASGPLPEDGSTVLGNMHVAANPLSWQTTSISPNGGQSRGTAAVSNTHPGDFLDQPNTGAQMMYEVAHVPGPTGNISGLPDQQYAQPAWNVPHIKDEISLLDAASYFQIYFEFIFPRYPFLSLEECSSSYLLWKKMRLQGELRLAPWPSFLTKMVCKLTSQS